MSNVGVDAGCSARVWDSHVQALVNELWWATTTPAGHGQHALTDAEFNAAIGHATMAAFVASLPPSAQAWMSTLTPDQQEGVFRSSQAQNPI